MRQALYVFQAILLLLTIVELPAQVLERQLLSSFGHLSEADGLNVSATGGELTINTIRINDLIFTQGFQQPDKKSGVFTNNLDNYDTRVTPWPNPFIDQLSLSFETNIVFNAAYGICDSEGKIFRQLTPLTIEQGTTLNFNTGFWAQGVYYFFIQDENDSLVEIIKIIKM